MMTMLLISLAHEVNFTFHIMWCTLHPERKCSW